MFTPDKNFTEWLKTKSPTRKKSPNVKQDTPHPDRRLIKRSPSIGKDILSPTQEEASFLSAMLEKEKAQLEWQRAKLKLSGGSARSR